MFNTPGPRLFHLPCGVDFPAELVAGLRGRMAGQPPEAMARVTLFVNSDRMRKAVRAAFDSGPPALLPRIRLVTDLADPLDMADLPQAVPPLRRRLELAGLVARLIAQDRTLAARAAVFDLADSLATLLDEMQAEGVPPEIIAALDVSDQSGHWERALRFITIVQQYFEADAEPDAGGLARMALDRLLTRWQTAPPEGPVVVAGSTGSRGTTHALMRAVACLPQGAVVLPGFDTHMPEAVWQGLTDALTGEDHPQFRYAKLMRDLELGPALVAPWTAMQAPAPDRNRTLSLALRPAPVTHQWLAEGPDLPDLPQAMAGVTLLEAPGPRDEATAIALRLRQAAERGESAALITPDRMLTRQVTSALDRWGIVPDDSAGIPAQLTAPGRLLRHVAALFAAPLSAEALLTLLKHPLCHSGADRGPHLLATTALELRIRKKGWAYPRPDALRAWGVVSERADWADWVADTFLDHRTAGDLPLADWVERHMALAEGIAGGPAGGSGTLWNEAAGRLVRRVMDDLRAEAGYGAEMTARDYADIFGAVLSREELRNRDASHPDIRILGTLEARVMGSDLMILAGLAEGGWPDLPGADPWLNRKMRADAGLLLPERRVGLSAHDFQQAAGAREIWLSRALKSDDAETVPSRWLNRLVNLLSGLPQRDGPAALHQMRARGADWLALARASEAPIPTPRAPRPAPAPPLAARPRELPVTAIRKLIRDPYAIYARYILGLRELDPLMRPPDALLRGILVHDVMDRFIKETVTQPDRLTPESLMQAVEAVIGDPENLPSPTTRILWAARLGRVADWFTETERARQAQATPAGYEIEGKAGIPALGFTLTAKADRIDIDDRGGAHLYDYKTGAAPTPPQQEKFDKQLLLEAAMLEQGGFAPLAPRHVAAATYISLAPGDPKEVPAPLEAMPPADVWRDFTALIAAYADAAKGYTARRALQKDSDRADYDHLSRFGEWDVTDFPETQGMD
ncbi:double-strand break repair protein AddB [Thetidibacter halocola]|uniref:Double-strand break repair protein AddB n=1 Tax=Thetidibacter halocola TaxID=2827239 RepID=A0A8J7WA51_9RHOB|nr:double-strand break repair protein AddB [Thetidibacter halocola]MBS0123757.1 double-strand break repair protein AddB [Thetidibacter halocola]